jgi:dolichol-phosphate mannosyltransferase
MKKLIIIATYNEIDNIGVLLDEIFTIIDDTDVLVIDDSSPDKTYELVENLIATKYQNKLFLIKRSGKLGLGTAYVAGFNYGLDKNYDVILHMDADFSHHPKYLPQFFEGIKTNDVVIGSRYVKGGGVVNWGIIRKIISRGGSLYSRIILGIKVKDLTGGYKCFKKHVLQSIDVNNLKSNGYSFQVETTYKSILKKFTVKEIPIIFEDRRVGQSKMSSKIFVEALFMIIKLKWLHLINKL